MSAHNLKSTSEAWATKAQQNWPVNVAINSRLLACKAEIGEALYYVKPALRVHPTAPENKGSRHNPQHAGWLIHASLPSFSPEPANEAGGMSQAPAGDQLLGLLVSYHRHAIGTFNTCSRGPTHWSLTDTGRGYNLGGASSPDTHSPTFPTSSPLSPSGPTRSPF
jgi:hypothetical protein